MTCLAPELKGKAGPEGCIVASGIEVPARATGSPDGTLHSLLHLGIECFLNMGLHLDGSQAASVHHTQAVQDVVDLGLDHEDH